MRFTLQRVVAPRDDRSNYKGPSNKYGTQSRRDTTAIAGEEIMTSRPAAPESETPESDESGRVAVAILATGPTSVTTFTEACKIVLDKSRSLERRLAEYQAKHTAIMREADRRYDEAQARIAELEKDAARYNVLRHPGFADFGVVNKNMTNVIEGEELDAAIDAALQGKIDK
jgi:hypothetical protein